MKKDIFYFSKSDRIATIVLLAIILGSVIIRVQTGNNHSDSVIAQTDTVEWIPRITEQKKRVEPKPAKSDSLSKPVAKKQYKPSEPKTYTVRQNVSFDTVKRISRFPQKTAPLQPIDLNAADSLTLVSLPGIGAYYASRILSYRNRLGGFVSTNQLIEIEGLPDSLIKWFVLPDTIPVSRICVNDESLTSLRRHPYLNFYQARAIIEFRRERGKIKGPEQLSLLEEFTEQDLERLRPYLDFR